MKALTTQQQQAIASLMDDLTTSIAAAKLNEDNSAERAKTLSLRLFEIELDCDFGESMDPRSRKDHFNTSCQAALAVGHLRYCRAHRLKLEEIADKLAKASGMLEEDATE